MEKNLLKLKKFEKTTLNLEDFMMKYGLKDDKIEENEVTQSLKNVIYFRDSKTTTNRGFAIQIVENKLVKWTYLYKKRQNNFPL